MDPMRVIAPALLLVGLSGCAVNPPTASPYRTVDLPYAACGQMAANSSWKRCAPAASARRLRWAMLER